MIKKIYITLSISVLTLGLAIGQNLTDVVRWSTHQPGGTARVMGVGGSFGAMGGDFSVININPAGLGEFAKGEFTISPSLTFTNSDAYLKGDPRSSFEDKSSLVIDNMGFVINTNPIASSWTHSNFAIGFSKVADLNKTFTYNGNTIGSITEEFAELANNRIVDDLDDFRAYPAYNVGAIFDLDNDNYYETDFQEFPNQLVNKSQYVDQSGSINEISFGWAGKYENKLNVGFSVGVPIISFQENKTYTEADKNGEISIFDRLDFTEYLNTSGAGINFKTGIIYDINKIVRLGASVHSPTWYNLNDDYFTSITYKYTTETTNIFDYRSPDGSFRYGLQSPWKAIGSIGSIYRIGQYIVGFVNADVEWVDYSEGSIDLTKFSSEPFEAQKTLDINREVDQFLGQAVNVRLGTELGINKLRLRGGISSSQSAFNADNQRNNALAFGIGLREDKFFIDLGVNIQSTSEGYLPYVVLDKERDPVVNINTDRTRVVMTAGFKF